MNLILIINKFLYFIIRMRKIKIHCNRHTANLTKTNVSGILNVV